MKWSDVVLILGLVWWVPAVAFVGVLRAKIAQNEIHAANLKVANDLLDKVKALG